jgi:cell division transport system permease protein
MITRYLERALEDILTNRFVNGVTVVTISLAVLIVSTAVLFFVNTGDLLNAWQQDTRIMAYLKTQTAHNFQALKQTIESMDGVQEARFIPQEEALEDLKAQMPHQSSLFDNLDENPLPDAFEIRLKPAVDGWKRIESIAAQIGAIRDIDDVEYGRKWVDTVQSIIQLFRATGILLIGLFCLAAVSIVANTTRLVIYSRREEVEIMRLVGAAEGFIKTPFYLEGVIQGFAGAAVGLGILYGIFSAFESRLEQSAWAGAATIRFLMPDHLALIVLGSMLMGWLGCYVSLKQFLKS